MFMFLLLKLSLIILLIRHPLPMGPRKSDRSNEELSYCMTSSEC
jgi:hypothetical protein